METFVLKMYLNVVLVLFRISMQCTIVSNVISIGFFFFFVSGNLQRILQFHNNMLYINSIC